LLLLELELLLQLLLCRLVCSELLQRRLLQELRPCERTIPARRQPRARR
jgi:hypothetical protein